MTGLWALPTQLSQADSPDAPYAIKTASWILYNLTGQKYRGLAATVEWYGYAGVKCMFGCLPGLGLTSVIASGVEAGLFKHSHSHVGYSDSVPLPRQLRLRNRPVNQITSITLGASGTVLNPSTYSLRNKAYVVPLPEGRSWDFFTGLTVAYTYGMYPPEAGRRAAITLADELVKCINADPTCRLPDRVTSISREGVSMTILDPQEFLKEGRTGLYDVDLFISAANPSGARKKPKVFSPDLPRGERTT